jgi:molybdopterin molybdotransferase
MSTVNPQTLRNPVRVADALAWIDAHVPRLDREIVPIPEATGRILAEDLAAAIDLPPFNRVTVDGFALRATETVGASAYNPLALRLAAAATRLPPNSAARVTSGDVLPLGTDAVIRLEHAELNAQEIITIIDPVAAGDCVERIGCHFVRGSALVVAGRRLSPGEIGALASAGFASVPVARRPRVHCLLAGAPVVEVGKPLPPGMVYDANSHMLRALVHRDGGVVVAQRIVERHRTAIADALRSPGVDTIVVAGGTGSGGNDQAAAALADIGELAIHGVALRPGETVGIGKAGGIPVVLLPGASAACLWSYELIAARVIRRLGGHEPKLPFACRKMTTARKLVSEIGTLEVHPVRCVNAGTVEPIASFFEAGLTPAARGDGFVLVPESSEGYPQGAAVDVYLYDG